MRIVPLYFLTRSYFKLMPRISEVNTECFKNKTQALTIKNHGVSRVNSRDFIKSDSYEVRLYIIIYIYYITCGNFTGKVSAKSYFFPQNQTSSPFSVAELLSVILTVTKSPIRCVPRSKTTTRFCSVRPKSWSRERLETPSTNTS